MGALPIEDNEPFIALGVTGFTLIFSSHLNEGPARIPLGT
jgi:hypothetical protein